VTFLGKHGLFTVLVLLTAFGQSLAAHAHEKKGTNKADVLDFTRLKADLASSDEKRVGAALATVEHAGALAKPAAGDVEALLRRGATTRIVAQAFAAAAAMKQPSSSVALAPYVRHRVAEVRRAAVKALVKTRGPAASQALRQALRSSDAVVRGSAASGLGTLGQKDALPELFQALDHRVGEAAASIGQLCAPDECERFADRLGKLPFDIMTSGFDQILFRAPSEMPDEAKIRIVGRLRELGTADAGAYLSDVRERWPEDWSKRVKQAIDGAVRAVGGSSKRLEQ